MQAKVNINIAEQAMTTLQESIARADEGARTHEFTRLTIVNQKVLVLGTEAENCIGEDLSFVGATRVDVEVDQGSPRATRRSRRRRASTSRVRRRPAAISSSFADSTVSGGTGAEPLSSTVPLQDLAAHHEPLLPELAAAAVRVLTSGRFIAGAETEAFEREVCAALSIPHAVGVSSGTDGLLAALMACGVGPGDQVVTTPFSFFASVGSIMRLGATPVFADIDPSTFNIDPAAAAARLGSKTRAVLVVHLFGRATRLDGLAAACAARNIPIVEDAAQAIGAQPQTDRSAAWVARR